MNQEMRLSTLERDLLVQLEEAGAEELTVVINSLSDSGASYPRRHSVLSLVEAALTRLHAKGVIEFVDAESPGFPAVRLGTPISLHERLRWEEKGAYWTPTAGAHPRRLGIARVRRST